MSGLALSVSAVTDGGGGDTDGVGEDKGYYWLYIYSEDDNFDGSSYVYNSSPNFAGTQYANTSPNSFGYVTETYFKVSGVTRNNEGYITLISLSFITTDYKFISAKEYSSGVCHLSKYDVGYRLNDMINSTISSIYGPYSYWGYKIDWSYIDIPEDMFAAGEQFTYYDYSGNPKTVTFNGNGGIFGLNSYEGELPESEFPDIKDYIPDINDEKYQFKSLSDYLPEMPDSLDIVDWVKYLSSLFPSVFSWFWDNLSGIITYLIDLAKGFFNFISDFLKAFFENLKNVFVSLFDTSDVDISARIDEVKEYAFLRIPILSTLSGFYDDMSSIMSSTSDRTAPVITFPTSKVFGGEDVTVSLEGLRPVTVITDVIIIAACYLLTLIYSIRSIPNIIGGIGSGSSELPRTIYANSFTVVEFTPEDNWKQSQLSMNDNNFLEKK